MLSMHSEETRAPGLAAGARGYVLKSALDSICGGGKKVDGGELVTSMVMRDRARKRNRPRLASSRCRSDRDGLPTRKSPRSLAQRNNMVSIAPAS
jgi:hypothetical protein